MPGNFPLTLYTILKVISLAVLTVLTVQTAKTECSAAPYTQLGSSMEQTRWASLWIKGNPLRRRASTELCAVYMCVILCKNHLQ